MVKLNDEIKKNKRFFDLKMNYIRDKNEKNFKYSDYILDNIRKPFFIIFMLIHVIYFIILIGLFSINVKYVNTFNRYVNYIAQLFISFYLLFKFNPLREYKCNKNDSIVIFWSALFLLFNLGVIKYIESLLLKNPTVDRVYTNTKTTYEKQLNKTSNFFKEKRQNLFGSEPPTDTPSNKPSSSPNTTPSEPQKPSSDKPTKDETLQPKENLDLVSTDTTTINNANNDLKYVSFN
jgi:hypothetical protein